MVQVLNEGQGKGKGRERGVSLVALEDVEGVGARGPNAFQFVEVQRAGRSKVEGKAR